MSTDHSLSEFHVEFDHSRMLARFIAGIVASAAMGVLGVILPERHVAMALFLCMPAVFPLGLLNRESPIK